MLVFNTPTGPSIIHDVLWELFISVFTSLNALAFTSHLKCTLSSEFNECDILTQSFTCSLISEKVAAFRRWINSHVKFCHGRCVFQEWCKNAVPDCNPHKPQTRRFGGERKYSRRVSTNHFKRRRKRKGASKSKKKCKWGPAEIKSHRLRWR